MTNDDTTASTARPGWLSGHQWVLPAITLVVFLCAVPWGVDPHHDGLMLKSAVDVAAGRVVFRDSFNQYGLLTPLLQGAAVRLFGAEIIVLRVVTVLFYALAALELDRLWRRFLSEPLRWMLFVLFLGLAPFHVWIMLSWPSVYALYFMLLGGELLLKYLDTGRLRWLCGAGAARELPSDFGSRAGSLWCLRRRSRSSLNSGCGDRSSGNSAAASAPGAAEW